MDVSEGYTASQKATPWIPLPWNLKSYTLLLLNCFVMFTGMFVEDAQD